MTVIKKYNTGTSAWETIVVGKQGPPGPVVSVAHSKIIIDESYTFPANYNGLSVGPVTIDDSVEVTVPNGAVWAIIPSSLPSIAVASISDLSDVATAGAAEGDVLTYDSSLGEWLAVGGGLSGTSYVFVGGDGTHAENGTELQAAYTAAKALTPYGLALSNTNRATVVVGPGTYDTTLAMDGQFVNVVSLDGNTSVRLAGIDVTADNVLVKGVDVGSASFWIGATNLDGLVAENCTGGNQSFRGYSTTISGTFINCTGGDNSFGFYNTTSGTFINCTGGNDSFGYAATASGTFTDCTAGDTSFGTSTASGTFTDCTAGVYSFGGYNGTASGTFTNCTGGNQSFGASGTLSGNVLWCRVTSGGFQTPSGGGKICMSLTGAFVETNQG